MHEGTRYLKYMTIMQASSASGTHNLQGMYLAIAKELDGLSCADLKGLRNEAVAQSFRIIIDVAFFRTKCFCHILHKLFYILSTDVRVR